MSGKNQDANIQRGSKDALKGTHLHFKLWAPQFHPFLIIFGFNFFCGYYFSQHGLGGSWSLRIPFKEAEASRVAAITFIPYQTAQSGLCRLY